MPYKVVSTIENGKAVLTSVPSDWEKDGILYWPLKGQEKLRKMGNSRPESNWKPFNCIVKRFNIATFNEAEHEISRMCNASETETDNDENYSRRVPKVSKRQVHTFDDIVQECISNNDMLSTTENQPTEGRAVMLLENLLDENSNAVVRIQSSDYVVKNNDILSNTENELSETTNLENAVLILQQSLPENSSNINTEKHVTVDGQGQLDISEIFNILLSKMDAVNENLKTIGTNILENVKTVQQNQTILSESQQAIMLSLSKLGVQLEEMIKCYSRPVATKETIESIQPITSLQDLIKMETSIKDPNTAAELKKRFSVICGKGKGRGINNAYLLVDAMFDRNFLRQCSWAGGSRSSDEKISFRSHTEIINFFFKIVHDSDNLYTLAECQNFFKNILKNSRQRSASKKMRTSTTKNRPKLKRNLTVNPEDQEITEQSDKENNEPSSRTEEVQSAAEKAPQVNQAQPYNLTDTTSSQDREPITFSVVKTIAQVHRETSV